MSIVYIGIGSNLGDRLENINKAVGFLKENKEVAVEKVSSIIETEPVGSAGPRYLNAAIKITTDLAPKDLLAVLQDTERKLGRRRPFKNAPRTIDLDILLYGDKTVDKPGLKIPHPRMFEREFVMRPLSEIRNY